MKVMLDITDIADDQTKIDERIEREYPYIGYMPIKKGRLVKGDKIYLELDVLSCG